MQMACYFVKKYFEVSQKLCYFYTNRNVRTSMFAKIFDKYFRSFNRLFKISDSPSALHLQRNNL